MNLLRGCLAGEYPISSAEELKDADAIIAQSFGTRERGGSPGRVNAILAEHASALALKYRLPIIAQEEIHDALPDPTGAFRVSGEASATDGSGLDSWAMLQRAHDLIGGGAIIERPIIVAQAHHIGRVAAQAVKLGMSPRLPEGMPRVFAPDSEQWWTHTRGLWVLREMPGMAVLRAVGKL